MADVLDIARGQKTPTFGQPAQSLKKSQTRANTFANPMVYKDNILRDEPGALAKIATALGAAGVSIDRMRQYGHKDTQAPVLIVTHTAAPRDDCPSP